MPLYPVPYDEAETQWVSQCWHHLRAADGELATVDGKPGTLTRASDNSVEDDVNNAFTVGYHIPTFERKVLFVDGADAFVMTLRLGANDRLVFDHDVPPLAFAFFFEFMHLTPSSGEALVSITNDAATGVRWWINWSGTYWRLNFDNGTTTTFVTLAAAPTNGQTVQLWGYLFDNGTNMWVQLLQSIQGAAATSTTTSTPIARASAWATGAKLRYSAYGTTAGATTRHRVGKLMPRAPSYAQLLRTF